MFMLRVCFCVSLFIIKYISHFPYYNWEILLNTLWKYTRHIDTLCFLCKVLLFLSMWVILFILIHSMGIISQKRSWNILSLWMILKKRSLRKYILFYSIELCLRIYSPPKIFRHNRFQFMKRMTVLYILLWYYVPFNWLTLWFTYV